MIWKLALFVIVVTWCISEYNRFTAPPIRYKSLPTLPWAKDMKKLNDISIRPFKIDVPQAVLDDLRYRLNNTRTLRDPLVNEAWQYGVSSTYVKKIIDYWQNKYNWTERQALLNKYPQYQTDVQGLTVHFYRVKPKYMHKGRKIKVIPLLLLHGWPGSVVEFQKIIPMLTTPRDDKDYVFEVIAPSLPGYGFSDAPARHGLNSAYMAVFFKNFMRHLGFTKYYVQGGDWGSIITGNMATLYPETVIGAHSNMCVTLSLWDNAWNLIKDHFYSKFFEKDEYTKRYGLNVSRLMEETGYMHLHATKPDTIGVALSDSPAGLAAYILEKFSTWTNPMYRYHDDGGLLEKFSMDELLDNVMIYWVTNSITTSIRLYAEQFNRKSMGLRMEDVPIDVTPTGCAFFPFEITQSTESSLRRRYQNLVHKTKMPRGGHFAAFEEPGLLSEDIYAFVDKVEKTRKDK